MSKKKINILIAGTSDYLPLGVVTAVSVKMNLKSEYTLKVHFLYADIVKPISTEERNNIFERAKATFDEQGIEYEFIDVNDKMYLLNGQNIGIWGKSVSMTHYIFMLAPLVLKDVNKIIYIDSDMIVNCDLSECYNIDLQNHLVAMGAPRGMEEMGDNVCNGGFVFINLELWRKENTIVPFLEFGRNLPKSKYCAQNLLHQYFTVNHSNRILKLDKLYNIFPQLFPEIPISEIKILHFTGWKHIKPWRDLKGKQRGGYLWWKYAKYTTFYEQFILENNHKHIEYNFLEQIFSIKKLDNEKYLMIFGFQIKLLKGTINE